MRRVLLAVIAVGLGGCQCTPPDELDGGVDGAIVDSGVDAGDAAVPDAGMDAGPVCGPELCDGIDNDCNGTIDLAADGGALSQLCPLQLGTCQGARVQCQAGAFPACTAVEYGGKFEEFESLCDGVDNDCSGVVDVSQWRPTGDSSALNTLFAVSVPGGWYIGTGVYAPVNTVNGQMFDEQLKPTSDVFPVGRVGQINVDARGAVSFAGYLNQLLVQFGAPGETYVRRLNLDGTYALAGDGGSLELPVVPFTAAGASMQVSNDRATLLAALEPLGAAAMKPVDVLTLHEDGGVRAGPQRAGDGGSLSFDTAPTGASEFAVGLTYPGYLEVQLVSADLAVVSAPLMLATPPGSNGCAIAINNTSTPDAGADALVVVCLDSARGIYGAQNVFAGGTLAPFWEADAGGLKNLRVLPSYARATAFWSHHVGTKATFWMSQLNGQPIPLAEFAPAPEFSTVAQSVRGGYLVQTVFDGGQGVRPYGAYVCPP